MAALTAAEYVAGTLRADRRLLAKTLTLFESRRADHQRIARDALTQLMPHTGNAIRVGISGPPGAGKSTLIEALGLAIVASGARLAVLAVDPSSVGAGGSILGDKTRMAQLSAHPNAFIRPSPSGGTLGGVARATREAMLALEAAGFEWIIVETVGVGQSETIVAGMSDLFLLVALPNAGDELQGIKRGVMELAEIVAVNKADGEQRHAAEAACAQIQSALQLLHGHATHDAEAVDVRAVSAREGRGVAELRDLIAQRHESMRQSGALAEKRRGQALNWMWEQVRAGLEARLRAHPAVAGQLTQLETDVLAGATPPMSAADTLLDAFSSQSE
ncbi:methylmalonyl Co-A mutase-associated GTPase MeaB [Magnetofaba australis]|uniref:Putative LAO/AO transporter ATPase n=1 Tax=Magnetofaba australis IT-1 TaxID=1434232 RepID=A0A1Y2KBP7_9PROT|nr:methylmalonyl Co-A mutase-associated GTPase MeaB [Magnetofaba australis]OSM07235.1 putative LAO/AO transporter ATPase [Magnetofaba australis IT-1]